MIRKVSFLLLLCILFSACKDQQVQSKVRPPGEKKTAETRTLESSTAVLQKKDPFDGFSLYLDGFHVKKDDIGLQMEVHHFCHHINEEFYECALFDGNTKKAHLVGIEYIISSKIFNTLSEEEKPLWSSLSYEVKSGLLVAPGLYDVPEHEIMERLASYYGKALHTWEINLGKNLPLAQPVLMTPITANGQLNADLLKHRDRKLGISTAKEQKRRADIKVVSTQQ